MRTETIDPTQIYRLPWSLTDNVLSWLEPTKRCNLYCEGCYSKNDPKSDKTLAQVRSDLEVFTKNRKVDSISIAGGDPLIHPDIVEIVRMIRHDYGLKPILNTNGLALTPELLASLKRAGAHGFTFHIDSSQVRRGWQNKTETELNELRLQYARMLADIGDLSCSFNSTVFPHTLHEVPALMDWARDHIDIVAGMVFILFRTSRTAEYDYFAQGKKVEMKELVYYDQDKNPKPLKTPEVMELMRQHEPSYQPCAYLGGTRNPKHMKWTIASRVGVPGKIYGYLGPRYMEIAQTGHHFLFNRYLGYTRPDVLGHGRSVSMALSPFDPGARGITGSWLKDVAGNPLRATRRLNVQSLLIIQPIDQLEDGEQDMCDGCPDMTVHEGKLVWSCRLEERLEHGCFLTSAPRCAGDKVHLPTIREPNPAPGDQPVSQA